MNRKEFLGSLVAGVVAVAVGEEVLADEVKPELNSGEKKWIAGIVDPYKPMIVIDNSDVPEKIVPNWAFSFTVAPHFVDEGEMFLLKDQKTVMRVTGYRFTDSGTVITAVLNGLRGQVFDGKYLFEKNSLIHTGFGNSHGEHRFM